MASEKLTPEQWGAAKADWENDPAASYASVAAKYLISKALLGRRAARDGWSKSLDVVFHEKKVSTSKPVSVKPVEPKVTANSRQASEQATPADLKEPVDDARPRAVVAYPAGFDDAARRVASEVVIGLPTRLRPVSGLVEPFPDLDRLPTTRSTEALIRAQSRDRMMIQLERRRQRLLVLDKAFVTAAKNCDPKSAQAALNLAKAQETLARLESELLIEHMDFAVNLVRAGRDPLATLESEALPSEDDEALDLQAEAEERARRDGTHSPTNALPPGWA